MPFCTKMLCHGSHDSGSTVWPCYIQFCIIMDCSITKPDCTMNTLESMTFALLSTGAKFTTIHLIQLGIDLLINSPQCKSYLQKLSGSEEISFDCTRQLPNTIHSHREQLHLCTVQYSVTKKLQMKYNTHKIRHEKDI